MALPDRTLTDGDLADVPGWKLRALHTPGHTPGHLCFVDERSRRLFSGDHILPRITPNISVQRGEPATPLEDYLNSLAKVRDLDVEEVLPAHEWRFKGLPERVDAIAAHHERRLAAWPPPGTPNDMGLVLLEWLTAPRRGAVRRKTGVSRAIYRPFSRLRSAWV
jgi:glyoxylase-like metal-dependent hydrolase (beta-lactamase superfamily II)